MKWEGYYISLAIFTVVGNWHGGKSMTCVTYQKKKSMTCVKELVCLWWFYIRVHCTCSVVFSTLLPIIYCLCLVLNSERLFFISYSFRILWLENLVQTCGINSMYLILSAMVLCKTGKIWVMCGTMHFTMNWK